MTKLFYREKEFIGLDINHTDIKVMSIDPTRWTVQGYGAMDVDAAEMKKALEEGGDYLALNLRKLLSEKILGALPSAQVILGIPTSLTYSRTFTVPASAKKNLREAVELEVGQYVPIPVALLYIDYEIVAQTKEEITVIMSAAPQAIINNILAACKQVDLDVNMIEPSINSVARVLKTTEDGDLATLIVDIGPATTDIAVLDGGSIRVTGGATIGGNTFTLSIAKKLGVALENAHQLKVLNGLSPGPRQKKITAALDPDLQKIASEARRVMRYYTERLGGQKIEQLLVVGGGSNVPGIGEYFTNELVMPARVASPWQKFDFGALAQPAKQFRPRYIAVAGLGSVTMQEVWG
jgi:type IV pilus assembly protein PilM